MSQYPPPQQPPIAPPPPGFPPAPGNPYSAAAPKQGNVAAIISLICGVLGCVPVLTSLLAVVLGIVGLRKTRDQRVGGKGLAIAGIILGLIGLGGWGLFGGGLYAAYAYGKPARAAAHQFTQDLAAGNIDAAAAATAGIPKELEAAHEQMKSWGALQDVTLPAFNYRNVNGVETYDLTGVASFASGGAKTYTVTMIKQNGAFKIQKFDFK